MYGKQQKRNTIVLQNNVPFLAETLPALFLWAQPPQPESIDADPDPCFFYLDLV